MEYFIYLAIGAFISGIMYLGWITFVMPVTPKQLDRMFEKIKRERKNL